MSPCPSRDQVEQLLAGEMTEQEACSLEAHIHGCKACQELIARLTEEPQTDAWRRLLRGGDAAHLTDAGKRFLEMLKDSPPPGGPSSEDHGKASTLSFPGPPTPEGPLGQLGSYHVVRELGAGGTGFAFQAYDQQLRRVVVLKVLRPELAASTTGRARFEREAQAAAAVHHEHVAVIHQVGSTDGFPLPYLVMEYVEGESLRDRLEREGLLPPREAAMLVAQVAVGLAHAHAAGLVHRDIKPSNILLEASTGRAKLTDFGLARAVEESADGDGRITQSGHILGTPAYMSPEQVLAPEKVDARSDVYSLGVVLYELLTGDVPFRGAPSLVMQLVAHEEPRPPRAVNPAVPRDVETIVGKCLARDPAGRYATASALADDLRRWLAGQPIQARPTPVYERTWKWARRNRAAATTLCLSLALAAVSLYFNLLFGRQQRETDRARQDAESQALIAREAQRRAEGNERQALRELQDRYTVQQQIGLALATEYMEQHRFHEAWGALDMVPSPCRGWECNHLRYRLALLPRPVQVVGEHEWAIVALCASRTRDLLATSGLDGRVLVWDTKTSRCRELERGVWSVRHGHWRTALAPSPDEPPDTPVPDCFLSLCWVEDGKLLAGASRGGKGLLWDLDAGTTTHIVQRHPCPLQAVAASSDGSELLFGDDQGLLLRIDRRTGNRHESRLLSGSPVLCAVPVAVGSSMWAVGQENGRVSLLDRELAQVSGHDVLAGPVWDLAAGPGGTLAAAGSDLRVYEIETVPGRLRPQQTWSLPPDRENVARAFQEVELGPDGTTVHAGDDLGRISTWVRGRQAPEWMRAHSSVTAVPSPQVHLLTGKLGRQVTGLSVLPDGQTLFTAGRDGAVRRWSLTVPSDRTEFRVGRMPKACFDPVEPALLWVGDADGSLAVWDSIHKAQSLTTGAHNGPIAGVVVAPNGRFAVTAGADGFIRFWLREAHAIQPASSPIRHHEPLRSLALSPDARRIAAYDADDHVCLWDVATGRQLAQFSLQDRRRHPGDRAIGGPVAFNADGNRLAVAGPGSTLLLLDGTTLACVDSPYLVAGEGGTVLAWHPRDPEILAGGDTLGRAPIHPLREHRGTGVRGWPYLNGPTRGLAFNATGTRLAAASAAGQVWLIDPAFSGLVLTCQSPHASHDHPQSSGLLFDPSGHRLALLHEDGWVMVWEASPPRPALRTRPARTWAQGLLLTGDAARNVRLRVPSIAIDRHDHLWMLYASEAGSEGKKLDQVIRLGRETETGLVTAELANLKQLDERFWRRSLALSADREELCAAFRQVSAGQPPTIGALALYRCPVAACDAEGRPAVVSEHALRIPVGNGGFDTYLAAGAARHPSILHFSHDGHYRQATCWSEAESRYHTRRLGRQGDGYYQQVATGPDGSLHLISRAPLAGPSRNTYLRLQGITLNEEAREVIERSPTSSGHSLAVLPDGTPVALWQHLDDGWRPETVVVRRDPTGWRPLVALPGQPSVRTWHDDISNLTCDATGTLRFAYWTRTEEGQGRLMLATGVGTDWSVELVWEEPQSDNPFAEKDTHLQMITLTDSRSRPVIVAWRQAAEHGWLRVFRPAE